MEDHDHPELDFDPLDDTKIWPKEQFPWLPVGKMTLNKNPENYFAEVEQSAFGTGVLVDRLDFSLSKTQLVVADWVFSCLVLLKNQSLSGKRFYSKR